MPSERIHQGLSFRATGSAASAVPPALTDGVTRQPTPTTDPTREFERAIDATPYFPALDGLRALSVILVLLSHVRQGWRNTGSRGLFGPMHGALGVTVFFVLSGFLITLLALREVSQRGRLDFALFYLRRAFRLFPLYYLVLAGYVLLVFVVHLDPRRSAFAHALPYYLTYLQEIPHTYAASTAPFEISWSLGIEEKFYLLWPIGAFFFARRPTTRIALAGMSVGVAYVGPVLFGARPAVSLMVGSYGAIALGCLLALLSFHELTRTTIARFANGWMPILALVIIGASAGEPILVAFASLLFIPALVTNTGVVAQLFASPPLVWLGRRSYGIYLVHQLALSAVRSLMGGNTSLVSDAIVAMGGLLLTIPIVALMHRYVEQPMIDRGRALTKKYRLSRVPPTRPEALKA